MRLRRAAGFTLIELLVALAVFALVAAAAVGVLRQSIEQRAAVQARLQQLRDFQIAHGLLRSDLQQAAVRRTRRTLKALAISTACTTARPTSTLVYWPWSISRPNTSGEMACPMSSPAYTTP